MEKLPKPNSPEHVEVVKTEVREVGGSVEFDFLFARAVEQDEITHLSTKRGGTIWSLVNSTFRKNGWMAPGQNLNEITFNMSTAMSPDRKRWVLKYTHSNPAQIH